jgi:hypothetical protein
MAGGQPPALMIDRTWYEIQAVEGIRPHSRRAFAGLSYIAGAGFEPATFGL